MATSSFTASDPLLGQVLGNHLVLSCIGGGGMGVVYLAEHTVLGRKAAIKVLLPEFSRSSELVQRFFFEARATSQLKHPAFVDVFDSGTLPDGSAYLIMEYLSGETLGAHLARRQRLPVGEALVLASAIAEGVGHAHGHDIVHRDLKPDNVFLVATPEGEVRIKVLDFGIAKLTSVNSPRGSETRTGMLLGTPLFMAPEQCRGAGKVMIDHRADVYALGCILHAMLSGQPPFPLEGFGEIISAQLSQQPPPLRSLDPGIPPPVEALVLRMLAKRPEDRPDGMAAVRAEIANLALASYPSPAAPPGYSPVMPTPGGSSVPLPMARTAKLSPHNLPSERPRATEEVVGGLSTFSSAASLIDVPPGHRPMQRSRVAWIGAGALGVVVVGAALLWLVEGRGKESPAEPPASHLDLPAIQPIAPEGTRGPPPAAAVGSPEKAPVPATVTMTVRSVPPGAEVIDGQTGDLLGSTPFERVFPAGPGTARLLLRMDGFRSKGLSLGLDRDQQISVTMDRRPAARHARAASRGTDAPPSKPEPKPSEEDDNDRRKL
jgi:serine/threonine-protein kinase